MLAPVIEAGETYAFPRDLGRNEALAYWLSAAHAAHIAEIDGVPVGTYWLRTNQPGGGDHVCNCAYVTASGAEGRGVGRTMLAHSLELARIRGYRAMQFNFVVATNTRAVATWGAGGNFRSWGGCRAPSFTPREGFVDALGDVEGPRRLSFPCRSSRNNSPSPSSSAAPRGQALHRGDYRGYAPLARRNPPRRF